MTTLAFDGKTAAIDSRITDPGVIHTDNGIKYLETEDITLFCVGDMGQQSKLFQLYVKQRESGSSFQPNAMDLKECRIYVFEKDKKTLSEYYSLDGISISQFTYVGITAFGSGKKYAIGAMDAGKNAESSVAIAAKRDSYTGGKVHVF
ncbi:hypothetical protein [Pseudoalteromonas luteoviolacea]|uniref:Proteasome subunit beta n=1 Tax=Pseudoalteromonas luteoviolacea S4060-1 TaxID=1365257 RepID=A0A162BK84_9GAMM|nr:hypothetical protein [Pseudoalteromonas luteoviolacea]KZN63316.1 hypothetical protein N478_03440 [Pseudoalteromonas luteoviolacea S4060-1]